MELLGSYQDKETVVCLGQEAARLREKYYGNKVYMRGLIEFTNFCKTTAITAVSAGIIKRQPLSSYRRRDFRLLQKWI